MIYVDLSDADNHMKILKIFLSQENLDPNFRFDELANATENLCIAAAYRTDQELLNKEKPGEFTKVPTTSSKNCTFKEAQRGPHYSFLSKIVKKVTILVGYVKRITGSFVQLTCFVKTVLAQTILKGFAIIELIEVVTEETKKKSMRNWQVRDTRELFYSFYRDMHKCIFIVLPLLKGGVFVPEWDYGLVLDEHDNIDILRSPFFDVGFNFDNTIEEYFERIHITLVDTIDDQRKKGRWTIFGRATTVSPPATSTFKDYFTHLLRFLTHTIGIQFTVLPLLKGGVFKLQGQQSNVAFIFSFLHQHEWRSLNGTTVWYLTNTTTSTSFVPRSSTSDSTSTTPSKNTSNGSTLLWWIRSTIKGRKDGGPSLAEPRLFLLRLLPHSKTTSLIYYGSSPTPSAFKWIPSGEDSFPIKHKIQRWWPPVVVTTMVASGGGGRRQVMAAYSSGGWWLIAAMVLASGGGRRWVAKRVAVAGGDDR
ncbi:hypothetical protein IEQ34_014889 [Dendrobium chrysotoxum]|uniref:Uncharacterized protein n=1 Tax=Dendrobium chrysotoxum TaxID=161865 RepID=A0AAV7GLW9_DENCH|nr:hypothetical protein IEQ34_014889 [Dendrobium chrysotoxum]